MCVEDKIKQAALALGFDLVGITTTDPLPEEHAGHLRTWLQRGYAGDMAYLEAHQDKRLDPRLLLDRGASVIVVGVNYRQPPMDHPCSPAQGRIAHYARGKDYHSFLKDRLRQLSSQLLARVGDRERFKICVDTAPVAERSLAQRAGLGFIGRNHMLIHPTLGPELFLGAILTTAALTSDDPIPGDCGDCRLCREACPTGALRQDGFLEATRCINYLTIEHRGDIPRNLQPAIGHRLYGCDACVRVCPYYRQAPLCTQREFRYDPSLAFLELKEVLHWTSAEFNRRFRGTPLERLGLERLRRNARICLKNAAGTV
jgi:epoxyqueuosine reductase